ncbi:SH3 domain-containing protein [Streptomyces phaeochromogenes]
MRTRTWFTALAAGAALLAGSSVTTAQAVPAAPSASLPSEARAQATGIGEPPSWTPSGTLTCSSHSHSNLDSGGGETTSTSTPRRSGPHSTCGSNPVGSRAVDYHCYTVNESGNTWTYVTVRASGAQGWVYDANLTNGGSLIPC